MIVYKNYKFFTLSTLPPVSSSDPHMSRLLNRETRPKILIDVAKGLSYLHSESDSNIIHRDLKPGNIWLDVNMRAKISDFGLAIVIGPEKTSNAQQPQQRVGILSYMAPEYRGNGILSKKCDVYSYGVVILEMITGRKKKPVTYNTDIEEPLLNFVWNGWKDDRVTDIIDASFRQDSSSLPGITRIIQIGLLCLQIQARDRPKMLDVVKMLTDSSHIVKYPANPTFTEDVSEVEHAPLMESRNQDSTSDIFWTGSSQNQDYGYGFS